MVSMLFHGRSEPDIDALYERLKAEAKKEQGPPWSCRVEALAGGRYRVTFVAAPVCVRQAPLEGTTDEIAAEFKRRLTS
jgi:hypothetical protein